MRGGFQTDPLPESPYAKVDFPQELRALANTVKTTKFGGKSPLKEDQMNTDRKETTEVESGPTEPVQTNGSVPQATVNPPDLPRKRKRKPNRTKPQAFQHFSHDRTSADQRPRRFAAG